jgi:hypothetical protein
VLLRQRDDLFEERQLDALRCRVRRKVDDQHPGFRERPVNRVLELGEEVDVGRDRHMPDVAAGDHRPVDVDRVAGVRDEDRVAAAKRCKRKMRDAFLRADGDDRLGLGIERDVVAPFVPMTDRPTQSRDAFRDRITVGVRPAHRLDQLVDDMFGCRAVGIAHPEVDDVLAASTRGHLELGRDVEDVRRQPRQALEIGTGNGRHAGLSA